MTENIGQLFPIVGEKKNPAGRRGVPPSGLVALLLCLVVLLCGPVHAEGAQTLRRDEFVSKLLGARGLPVEGGDPVRSALDYDLIPSFEGNPGASITRAEAVLFAVHSLGLSHEAKVLADLALPFNDVGVLPPISRGSVVVALHMKPQLIKKGASTFRPSQAIAPAEAKSLLAAVAGAGKQLLLSVAYSPAQGMTVRVTHEGAYTGLPKWRAFVGGHATREEADALCASMNALGLEATVDSYNYDWRVRTPLYDRYGKVRQFLDAAASLGREGVVMTSKGQWESENVPKSWIAVTLSPNHFEIRPVFPRDGLSAIAPLSSFAMDGALVAMNGGYFTIAGRERGAPIGTIMTGGRMVNAPYTGRTTMGWSGMDSVLTGRIGLRTTVDFPGIGFMEVTAINQPAVKNGVVLYTEHFGARTPVSSDSVIEMVLDGDVVEDVRRVGGNPFEPGKSVLAVYGTPTRYISSVQPGDVLKVSQVIAGDDPQWNAVREAVQGGPCLIRNGQTVTEDERMEDSFLNRRHPRTVLGRTEKGEWLFFVGDGRSAIHSVGFTLQEVTDILKKMGVVHALNLDGGGSSTMLERGRVLNVLSDGRERPISYGIGAFPKGGD